MKTTTVSTVEEAKRAMEQYANHHRLSQATKARFANEMEKHAEQMKLLGAQLIEFGKANRDSFDEKENLELGDGYLHIEKNTVVLKSKKFDAKEFGKAFPECFDIDKAFKVAPLKKAFLDNGLRKELKSLGVSLDTQDDMKVCLHKEAVAMP